MGFPGVVRVAKNLKTLAWYSEDFAVLVPPLHSYDHNYQIQSPDSSSIGIAPKTPHTANRDLGFEITTSSLERPLFFCLTTTQVSMYLSTRDIDLFRMEHGFASFVPRGRIPPRVHSSKKWEQNKPPISIASSRYLYNSLISSKILTLPPTSCSSTVLHTCNLQPSVPRRKCPNFPSSTLLSLLLSSSLYHWLLVKSRTKQTTSSMALLARHWPWSSREAQPSSETWDQSLVHLSRMPVSAISSEQYFQLRLFQGLKYCL